MTKETVEDDKESKISDNRRVVKLVEVRGKTVEIVELKMVREAELSLEQSNLTNSGGSSLAHEEPTPMEVEIVTRTATSAAESPMSVELPCSDPPASHQSIFEPESESSFEPLPMSTEPSSKDAPLPLPVAMSVSPAGQTDATDMKSDEEEGLKGFVAKDELQKSRIGEKPRQGIRVLLPKGESKLGTEEVGLGPNAVESLHRQDPEDVLFKSPMRPAIPSPARTSTSTNFVPSLESATGSLGNLSPASLPSPGYTPRSIYKQFKTFKCYIILWIFT